MNQSNTRTTSNQPQQLVWLDNMRTFIVFLVVVRSVGKLAGRPRLFYRFCLVWGTLFLPLLASGYSDNDASFIPSGKVSWIWMLVWLTGVLGTTTLTRVNWIDKLTSTRVVRQ